MQLESLYQEIILDHYRHPQGKGLGEPFEGEAHHINPTCGDELTVRVHLTGAGAERVIASVTHDGQGCSISQASVSVLHDLVTGATPDAANAVYETFRELMHGRGQVVPDEDVLGDAVAFAGVAKYPARVKCALLGWMAWKDAMEQAMGERTT